MQCKENFSHKSREASLLRRILMGKRSEIGRRRLLVLAKIAEKAALYEDMLECMKMNICNRSHETSWISVEERNLFSIAYLQVLERKRKGLRNARRRLRKSPLGNNQRNRARKMLNSFTKDLNKICMTIHDVVLNYALPATQRFEPDSENETEIKDESVVFWLKMLADCSRYRSEIQNGTGRKESLDTALRFYSRATRTAAIVLLPTSPVRLGLALNFASFHLDVIKDPESALTVLDLSYQDALAEENSIQATLPTYQTTLFLLGNMNMKIENLKRILRDEKRRKSPSS